MVRLNPTGEGRSPRMRGGPTMNSPYKPYLRSIPAYAGGTYHNKKAVWSQGVDPRVCGGDASIAASIPANKGRSPRMRGGRHRPGASLLAGGSIPAYAGGTLTSWATVDPDKVDPRVCGGDVIGI